MTIAAKLLRCLVLLLLGAFAVGQAQAQATRTWISGVGDDVNPCSRTAPCKTFPGAIAKTAAGGIIDVLDPAAYGAVTITKSITLESVGNIAGILVAGTNGITVSDASSGSPGKAIVVLRGLSLDGGPPGSNSLAGVRFISGGQLIIEHCDIGNFTGGDPNGFGIAFTPSSAASLVVRDSTIHDNGATGSSNGGILVSPTGSGSATVTLDNVHIVNNTGFGLQVQGPAKLSLRDSVIGMNTGNGLIAIGGTASASALLDRVTISGNGAGGVVAQGAGALIDLSDSSITGNLQGLQASGGGSIVSFGNNRNFGNTVDGAPSKTGSQQ
ncbi:MAG TPA: right-handed parallel beta-helix repeat-containing protein [Rudaea sp.]|nr:right-handed parallel beta-helix repeat-containing protein [Rudaea sp.]